MECGGNVAGLEDFRALNALVGEGFGLGDAFVERSASEAREVDGDVGAEVVAEKRGDWCMVAYSQGVPDSDVESGECVHPVTGVDAAAALGVVDEVPECGWVFEFPV